MATSQSQLLLVESLNNLQSKSQPGSERETVFTVISHLFRAKTPHLSPTHTHWEAGESIKTPARTHTQRTEH